MRLASRAELGLDPQVDLHGRRLEPAPAPRRQMRRFRLLRYAEQPVVEAARLVLAPRRHRQLHVLDRDDGHAAGSAPPAVCGAAAHGVLVEALGEVQPLEHELGG